MKVLHVFDHSIPLHSGYTFRSRAILRQQRALGIETCHITSPKQGECENVVETVDDLRFYRSNQPTGLFSVFPGVDQLAVISSLRKKIAEVIEIERPDVIHAHSPALNGLAAIQVAKDKKIPVVYEIRAFWEDAAVDHGTCREGDFRYKLTRALENYVVKHASAVTTICKGLQQDLIKRGVAKAKLTEIPNAVEVEKFTEKEVSANEVNKLREKYGLNGKYVLGFVGSFYAYEGLDLLLEAMSIVVQTKPNVHLLLVGGGPQDANLKKQVEQLNLQDKVTFTGRVPHESVALFYDMIDLLAFPRKSMRLTELVTPLKPLEAMAQHKLVLASDVGGHKELIENGKTGYLFEADNVEALAAKIIEISQSQIQQILNNGFDFVKNERNWKVSVSHYLPLYDELVKNGS
ncbi:glycosyltransferase family 4 protein [Alteromonas sp. MTD1]|uniref:TIGR04063 family PEP-CTERM/XrtA system glycosyltransferase n=1 Tax=Alteromonas sp. MTD1 TaxID=3057962 RepID=UPI0036F19B97